MFPLTFRLQNVRIHLLSKNFSIDKSILNILTEMKPQFASRKEARMSYERRKLLTTKGSGATLRLKVVGSGAHGAPKSVHLFTENSRYLFNCGEGTQRIAAESKIKLSRVPHVFITYPSWENVAGLIGLALTVQSIGIPELFIHGHEIIENVYTATNKFIDLKRLKVNIEGSDPSKEYSDGSINIKYVHLYSSSLLNNVSKKFSDSQLSPDNMQNQSGEEFSSGHEDSEDDIDYYDYLHNDKKFKNKSKKNSNKNKRSLSEVGRKKIINPKEKFATAYICKSQECKGKLLIEKCVDLGLKPGPILGKLKDGEDVELPNGTIVKSSDVVTPPVPGAVIIVLECPGEDYLDSLLKEPAFHRHQTGDINSEDIASVVVHFTSPTIVKTSKYQEWIARFSNHTKHLYINEDSQSLGPQVVYEQQYVLNLLHPEIFPVLDTQPYIFQCNEGHSVIVPTNKKIVSQSNENQDNNESQINNESPEDRFYCKCVSNNNIQGETLCVLYLRPVMEYDYSCFRQKNEYVKETMQINGFSSALEDFKVQLKEIESTIKSDNRTYPKILFLGTGGSQPNKRRNTSGILVFLDEKNTMLLDCGEGTYGQIVRFFGKTKARELLRNLNLIYISHLHADHHLGLVTLLTERKLYLEEVDPNNLNPKKIYLMAPAHITTWLNLYSKYFHDILNMYTLVKNWNMKERLEKLCHECLENANLKDVKMTFVKHCHNAFGVAFTHNDGWKLTYSGDTKPCPDLIEIGKNCDILIHEATIEDSLPEEAALKLHSTTSQAIEVGQKMNAKFTLLTHFSQRYSHLPLINENFNDSVGIAFDNMLVSMNQLPILPKMIPVLKVLFSQQYEKMEEKRNLREVNKKRKASTSLERPVKSFAIQN